MKQIITDDAAMVETMKRMVEHFGLSVEVEALADDRFRLTMSDEDATKLRQLTDRKV